MSTLHYYDGSEEIDLTTANFTYYNGTSTTVFGTNKRLSFWNGTTEIPLLGSIDVTPPADGPLTQATMPSLAEAWDNAPLPTVTTTTSSTVSGTLYTPATANLFKPVGTKVLVSAATSGYWRAAYMADKADAGGADPLFVPSYGVKFTCTAATIEVKIQQRPDIAAQEGNKIYRKMPIRIKVNGQWTSSYPIYIGAGNTGYDDVTVPTDILPGDEVFVKIVFASATSRTVEIFTQGEFGGVRATAGSITAATAPKHTAVVLGDSLTGGEKHGTGNWSLSTSTNETAHHATYSQLSSMWGYVCQSLGYDNVVTSSAGSSGYTIVGDTTFYKSDARLDNDVIAHNPELVMVGTSFNDVKSDGSNVSAVESAANYTISKIKAECPDAIIFMLGNPKVPVIPAFLADGIVGPYNTMLKGVAADQSVWFYNPYDGKLYNPSGALVYTDPNGGLLNGRLNYISSDDTHPTQEGAKEFGKLLSGFIRRAHPVS